MKAFTLLFIIIWSQISLCQESELDTIKIRYAQKKYYETYIRPRAGCEPELKLTKLRDDIPDAYYIIYSKSPRRKKREGLIIQGAKEGRWIEWFSNGNKAKEIIYEEGKALMSHKSWYDTGELKYEVTNNDSTGISRVVSWYRNGNKQEEYFVKEGVRHGIVREWYANGQAKFECDKVMGKKNGIERQWNREGVLVVESEWKSGVLISRKEMP